MNRGLTERRTDALIEMRAEQFLQQAEACAHVRARFPSWPAHSFDIYLELSLEQLERDLPLTSGGSR